MVHFLIEKYIGMVYAMLSIGVLGFIVWSNLNLIYLMALLIYKQIVCILIINFTLGWYSLRLYNTFYSTNLYNYIKSAGYYTILNNKFKNKILIIFYFWSKNEYLKQMNINFTSLTYLWNRFHINNINKYWLTSETLRENTFDFSLFKKIYLQFFKKEFSENNEWLTWFIGFTEGDGAIMSHNNRLTFVITQKDPKVLFEIQIILGFGVVKHFKGFSRYIVSNNIHCFLLYLIFNGNLVINYRVNQLNRWYNTLLNLKKLNLLKNFDLIVIPNIITILVNPTLDDSWLSGFTDAEGCFSVSISKGKNNVKFCRCRYILDQKGGQELLSYIRNILCYGSVNLRNETQDVYRLTVSMNKPTRQDFKTIIKYFDRFHLKTTKIFNYEIWCKVIDLIKLNEHNTTIGIENIRKLRTELNKYIIENKSMGSSKYS